jgi:hypothetical protein
MIVSGQNLTVVVLGPPSAAGEALHSALRDAARRHGVTAVRWQDGAARFPRGPGAAPAAQSHGVAPSGDAGAAFSVIQGQARAARYPDQTLFVAQRLAQEADANAGADAVNANAVYGRNQRRPFTSGPQYDLNLFV